MTICLNITNLSHHYTLVNLSHSERLEEGKSSGGASAEWEEKCRGMTTEKEALGAELEKARGQVLSLQQRHDTLQHSQQQYQIKVKAEFRVFSCFKRLNFLLLNF